ncbi:hypothetical protein [Pseudomonas serbica]|uniref:hypothetical protein n=1 Tax=Pseudomonas serbica TaxID=2965074 RepID=UPI00237AE5E0|nr:hypothetical protein [Pseudomonas serbica]
MEKAKSVTMEYAEKVKALRDWSGEVVSEVRRALKTCDEDLFVAAGLLRYEGCLVSSPNPNWALDKAKANAADFVLSDEGKLVYKPKPVSSPRLSVSRPVVEDSKFPGER